VRSFGIELLPESIEASLLLQERIETVGDDADLQEVYDTERHLLYIACTRAPDHLLITSVEPASEFLDDLRM
jgi:superfamily I DNA/RNA helicase